MPLQPPPQEGSKDDVISWLYEFEKEYGYEDVAVKWTKGNFRALWDLEKEKLKKKFGDEEGSIVYKVIHSKGKNTVRLLSQDQHLLVMVKKICIYKIIVHSVHFIYLFIHLREHNFYYYSHTTNTFCYNFLLVIWCTVCNLK